MLLQPINCDEFLRAVIPALMHESPDELAASVGERWSPQQLCQLLYHDCADLRQIACLVLGLVGDEKVTGCLAAALRDGDEQLNQLAEHALWSIWFRAGAAEAQPDFQGGLKALEREEPRRAIEAFRRAQRADPTFTEAFNQCSIAHYMLDEWRPALDCCRRAIDLTPLHFGALAGAGHCHAQLGDLPRAAHFYRRTLGVNPRMEEIALILQRIDRCVSGV